jgi:GT2 family glycosyltransferase
VNIRCGHVTGSRFTRICARWRISSSTSVSLVTDSLARRRRHTPAFSRGFPAEHPRANRQLEITRNCSAVSGACMLTRREVFQEVGGFDEGLMESFADIDLCLKMRRAGYLIVYASFAKRCWHEPHHDKIDPPGEAIMRERWSGVLQRDAYYDPSLSREDADFSLGNRDHRLD